MSENSAGFYGVITPTRAGHQFWDDFATVLCADRRKLPDRLIIHIFSTDKAVLNEIFPYVVTALFERVALDVQNQRYVTNILPNRGLRIATTTDAVKAKKAGSIHKIFEPDGIAAIYKINNSDQRFSNALVGLHAIAHPVNLVQRAFDYTVNALEEKVNSDLANTTIYQALPNRGLQLVPSVQKSSLC